MIWKPPAKKTSFKSLKESGNMILAIFGAVALVGTIGAGTSLIVNGPMKVMSQVNQSAQTESQMMVASKMVMLDVANLPTSGDCDGDSLTEPREWRDAAGLGPDGVADSDGGGFIPMQIGASKRDSWGTQYGYCVWDHGALVNDGGCAGGAGQNRLQGFNSIDHPAVAIISAGPNGIFETPCRDFDNADNDSDDVLDYAAGDDPLISPTGDDIVAIYSYAEAAEDNLGIWELAVDPSTNEAIARTNKDVEFTGSSTSFGGTLTLDGTQGLDIPDDASLILCDNTVEGQIRRNMSNDPPTLEVCEDTGGSVYAWAPLATSTPVTPSDIASAIADPVFDGNRANCTKNKGGPLELVDTYTSAYDYDEVFIKDGYIFATGNGASNIDVLTFDGTDFTLLDSISMNNNKSLHYDDGVLFIGVLTGGSNGLNAYSFNGESFSLLDQEASASHGMFHDGAYIYSFDSTDIKAHTFDGTALTNVASSTHGGSSCGGIWADNKYVYMLCNDLRAYSFNGNSFSLEGSVTPTGAWQRSLNGDNNYTYISKETKLYAYTFNGDTFDLEASSPWINGAYSVRSDGVYIYTARTPNGVSVFKKSGSSLIEVNTIDTPGNALDAISDGTYLYVADGASGLHAYSGFTCTEAYVPDIKETSISQITVEQTGSAGDTLGSAGWAQVLASDDNGDQTGIAFVVDKNASKGSAPTAAITAIREADPGAAGLAFKTRSSDGTINNRNYLGHSGYLGLDVTAGTTANLFSTLQIGDHSTTWHADFQKGLFVTSNDGSDQIGYFGFYDDTTDTNTIIFSKSLKIKGSNITGNALREYIRFESSKATTFFGNLVVAGEAQTTSIQNKSYSAADINDGELNFKRKRLDSAGADVIVQDGDTIGNIKFQGFDGTSMNENGPTITAKVDGAPVANNIPTELSFKIPQTNFDPEAANCASNNSGPFVEVASFDTPDIARSFWSDNNYIYVADSGSGVRAYSFNGESFTELGSFDTDGDALSVWGDGTYIYVADNLEGVQAFTFDGTTFTKVGFFNTPGAARSVWGDGTYIYVADWGSGLRAYSFNGTVFTEVAFFDTSGQTRDVIGDGKYIYIADRNGGLQAYSFDGTTFTLEGTMPTANNAQSIWLDQNYIYISDDAGNLIAFTFDGNSFTAQAIYPIADSREIWSNGKTVFLGGGVSGIHALSIKDGSIVVDIHDTPTEAIGVWGDARYVYVADGAGGIRAFSGYECNSEIKIAANDNVGFQKSDPESKLHVGGRILADEGILVGNEPLAISCVPSSAGTMRYNSGEDEPLEVCNGAAWIKLSAAVPDPEPSLDCSPIPFELRDITDGTASTEYTSNGFIVGGLDTDEECYLSLASDASSAKINLNGTDETSKIVPVVNGDVVKIKATSGASASCVKSYASLGKQTSGFALGALGTTVTEIDTDAPVGINASDVVFDGEYIYVHMGINGIGAYSFDGTTLTEIDRDNTYTALRNFWTDNEYVYALNEGVDTLIAYDFDGTALSVAGSIAIGGSPKGISGDGTYIYIVQGGNLTAYTFNGTTFTQVGTPIVSSGWQTHADNGYIFVTLNASGVQAYTFDGSNFTAAGPIYDTTYASGIRTDGNFVYVADDTAGVEVLTFDGSAYTSIATYDTAGTAYDLEVVGSRIFVADNTNGIVILKFDGSTLTYLGGYDTSGLSVELRVNGQYIYNADSFGGVGAYSYTECSLEE